MMLAPVTHILPQTVVQRMRMLPREGQVTVRQGQTVRSTDVVAKANLKPRHYMLDVAAGLGVSRAVVGKYIERYENDVLAEGDVIARKTGLFSRIVRSPVSGKIVLLTDGFIMLEEEAESFELLAGIPGEVVEISHGYGVVVETTGSLVQGAWGNGRIDFGILNVVVDRADGELDPELIDVGLRGAVLLAGHCSSADAFRRATEQRLRGLVLGSMLSELIPIVRKLAFPVLLTDGFGRQPMNPAAFKLLSTSDKRDIAINAEPTNPETGARPEVVIPSPVSSGTEAPASVGRLTPGQQVRITRAPHKGVWGSLATLLPGRTLFPNGLRLPAAVIQPEEGEPVTAPLSNLEIVNSRR